MEENTTVVTGEENTEIEQEETKTYTQDEVLKLL